MRITEVYIHITEFEQKLFIHKYVGNNISKFEKEFTSKMIMRCLWFFIYFVMNMQLVQLDLQSVRISV